MQNVTISNKGMTLTIVVDLGKQGAPSKSGKSLIVASTGGFAPAGVAGYSVALNVIQKQ